VLPGSRYVAAAAAGTAAVAAFAIAPAGAGRSAPPSETSAPALAPAVRTLQFDVTVGPADDRRTCTVVADLYVPANASRRNPVPAILTTNGFGGSKDDQAGIGEAAAERGYVVLSYSGLGFGGSGCKIYVADPRYDGQAGRQLVDFLAGRKRANDGTKLEVVELDRPGDPRVGMIGESYGGQIQFAVMAVDQRLDALVPLITWNDLAYALAPNNTAFRTGVSSPAPGVFKRWWAGFFTGVGVRSGVEHAHEDPSRLEGCPNFRQEVCQSLTRLGVLGYPDAETHAWTRQVSVASYIDKVTAPTLLMQGQADTLFNLQEAVATYRALERRGVPVRMIWQVFGHSGSGPTGEFDDSPAGFENSYLGRRALGWLDYWLKGERGASLGPKFAYFRDWAYRDPGEGSSPGAHLAAVTQAYGAAGGYPVGGIQPLYLSGDGSLVPSKHAVKPGSQSYASPPVLPTSYSETSAAQATLGDQPPPADAPGTFAAWTTAPLAHDVDTVGVPTVEVRLDSASAAAAQAGDPAGRLVVFAKLYDVAPDGSESLRYRLVSPVRVPDVTRPVRIELPGVVHRWQQDHRIKLVLAGSDWAYTGNWAAHPVTVTTDPLKPAVLRLPVLGARVG